jgi:hypothetical protein
VAPAQIIGLRETNDGYAALEGRSLARVIVASL